LTAGSVAARETGSPEVPGSSDGTDMGPPNRVDAGGAGVHPSMHVVTTTVPIDVTQHTILLIEGP
jgi:hypothetical protein